MTRHAQVGGWSLLAASVLAAWWGVGGCVRAGFPPVRGERDGAAESALDVAYEAGDGAADDGVDARRDVSDAGDGGGDAERDAGDGAADMPIDSSLDGAADSEAGAPDLGVDLPPGPPCSAASTLLEAQGGVALCESSVGSVDQCTAHELCNEQIGFTLCPASFYRAAVTSALGDSLPPAWIGGCIRDGAGAYAPVDGPCSCASGAGASAEILWSCGDGTLVGDTPGLHLGVVTMTSCHRVGANSPQTEGYWGALNAGLSSTRAVCCRP